MANTLEELTQRMDRLERLVERFAPQDRGIEEPLHEWNACLGIITDDALSAEIIEAGLRLREAERAEHRDHPSN